MTRRSSRRQFTTLAATALLILAPTLTGCMTVHGERENIPSVKRTEAPKALKRFTDTYNQAYRDLDPALLSRVEAGPLEAIGIADLTAQRVEAPQGNPRFPALELSDTHYVIPRQVGWPKFFVADTRSNRDAGGQTSRWLLVFTRDGAGEPWRVAYLSILSENEVPQFATDADGFATSIPVDRPAGLRLPAGALSKAYTDYLMTGKGDTFAPGQSTSVLRENRKGLVRTPKFWTEYIDTPAKSPRYAPVGLRTKDGGALVFFASHHLQKQTMAKGYKPHPDKRVEALMTGEARKSVTLTRVSESAVSIPPREADGGQVTFLNRIEGVVAAKGE